MDSVRLITLSQPVRSGDRAVSQWMDAAGYWWLTQATNGSWFSTKTATTSRSLAQARQRGQVWLFDPFLAAGLPAIHWSPLVGTGTWPGALDMAYWLTQAASVSHSVQYAEFWETMARLLLAPLLYTAANQPTGTMGDVLAWANRPERADEVLDALDT